MHLKERRRMKEIALNQLKLMMDNIFNSEN